MEIHDGIKTYHPKNRKAWRAWLTKNHEKEKSVWSVIYKKESGKSTVNYEEAVEEALCFGWIDSKPNKRDKESYYQFFARRKTSSKWSSINKKRVEKLIKQELMTQTGIEAIEKAKKNGNWIALDDIEKLTIPGDLKKSFKEHPPAEKYFNAFPRSVKRGILEWISNAKTLETRNKRILETATLAAKNIRANQYTPKSPI